MKTPIPSLSAVTTGLLIPLFAFAQGAAPASVSAAASAPDPMAGHDMSSMPDHDMSNMQGHDMSKMGSHDMSAMGKGHAMEMKSSLGPYSMTREGSGTSWQPEATPMQGLHFMRGDWSLMAHGFVNAIYDKQTGPRGDEKAFTESMAMLMANRPAGPGTLGLRAMLSLDPTMGKSGYPLLFQTGETANGSTPLVDRQHPHDFFMELSTSYSIPFGNDGSVFAYFGLPGEPALGPPAFMHRFSGMRNPEAPLTHHWLDSTHITFGVATLGVSRGPFQLEGSWFNGREPDQFRWNIETRRFDSWSARFSYNPLPELSMQVSYGDLERPEQLEPDVRVRRTTASATYHLNRGDLQWATTAAYGRNRKTGPSTDASEPGWLLESTLVLRDTHAVFARVEQVDNSELFEEGHPLHGETFRIRKLSLGYIFDFAKTGPVKWGIGGLVGFLDAPSRLDPYYGSSPRSYMVCVQGRL
jgi:hypothetical protein